MSNKVPSPNTSHEGRPLRREAREPASKYIYSVDWSVYSLDVYVQKLTQQRQAQAAQRAALAGTVEYVASPDMVPQTDYRREYQPQQTVEFNADAYSPQLRTALVESAPAVEAAPDAATLGLSMIDEADPKPLSDEVLAELDHSWSDEAKADMERMDQMDREEAARRAADDAIAGHNPLYQYVGGAQ